MDDNNDKELAVGAELERGPDMNTQSICGADVYAEEWCLSKGGYEFNYFSEVWRIDGDITINFRGMPLLNPATVQGFRRSLCRYAEELSAKTTRNVYILFMRYVRNTGAKTVDVESLASYRSSLSREDEYYLGNLKGMLLAWCDWGYPGIDNMVAKYLQGLVLRCNIRGRAVRKECPYSGPYTDLELGALSDEAANLFQCGDLDLIGFAFFSAIAITGRRPQQIRHLRNKDLMSHDGGNGNNYVINIPRAKQRNARFRSSFRSLTVNEDLYLLLQAQGKKSIDVMENQLGKELPGRLRQQVPIFLHCQRVAALSSFQEASRNLAVNRDWLHMTSRQAQSLFANIGRLNTTHSERTGDFISINAYRFRYTKGTNLVRRGIGGASLAVALDHSDTNSIHVYTQNTIEEAKAIDAIMAPTMAPLAQAFSGTLIASEGDALRAGDPYSVIKNGRLHPMGNCGTHAFCSAGYRACYTCINFQPWINGPHEEVLEEVLAERERQKDAGVSESVIQSTDRLLLAVTQVVHACGKIRTEKI